MISNSALRGHGSLINARAARISHVHQVVLALARATSSRRRRAPAQQWEPENCCIGFRPAVFQKAPSA